MKQMLNGTWELTFFPEEAGVPLLPPEIGDRGYPVIPAQVPGDAVLDLMRAGLTGDPFWGENLYQYRPYEFYRWMYRRRFTAPEGTGRLALHFEGVNTVAAVFLNGRLVGECDNMLIPHTFDVTDTVRRGAENDLAVVIRSAVNEARRFEMPVLVSSTEHADEAAVLRMPPSCFGWDIMPRLLSAGLWRDVWLEEIPAAWFTQVYYATEKVISDAAGSRAVLQVRYRFAAEAAVLDDFSVRFRGSCGESRFEKTIPARFVSGNTAIEIPSPKLWWPAGYGEPWLYDVTAELLYQGQTVAQRQEKIGLRTLEIDMRSAPGEAGEFLVKANGVPILCKGSNWVPLSALHSQDAGRYEMALALWKDMGCNILRCWGGNVYEDDRFYELCDAYGIMVWQDFSMACLTYPQDRDFQDRIYREAEAVILRRRNHPCLLLWAGDNEVDESYRWQGFDAAFGRYNALTREVLPLAVRQHDPYRRYMPSSPYIPENLEDYATPEQHNWGARAWYKDDFYKHTTAHFISECGYHGCPSLPSLREFIPPEELWPIGRDGAWDAHSTDNLQNVRRHYNRNGLMADQVRLLCGEVPQEAETFILLSQLSQAEADKFFVERTRIGKWRRTGIIWWNMIDGWPQISDAVVDWYGRKKLAYTWLRRVHVPVCLMLDEVSGWEQKVILGNDSRRGGTVTYEITDADSGECLLSGCCESPANENVSPGKLRVIPGEKRLLLLCWTYEGRTYHNHYLTGFPPYDAKDLLRWIDVIRELDE